MGHLQCSFDDVFHTAWLVACWLSNKVMRKPFCQGSLSRTRQARKRVQARSVGIVDLHALGYGGPGPARQLARLTHLNLPGCACKQGTQVKCPNALGGWEAHLQAGDV